MPTLHSPHPPEPAPPLDDVHVRVGRQVLAELPRTGELDGSSLELSPHYWVGRLSSALANLVAAAAPGGLDHGQREVVGQALADAIEHRTPEGFCAGCEVRPGGLCNDCAADLDLTDAYLALGRELGIEVSR